MLYDPKWQKKAASDLTFSDFILWLETKNPSEQYNWMNCQRCAVGQFITAMTGAKHPSGVIVYEPELFGRNWGYQEICGTAPHTFGAALERARNLAAKSA